MTVFRLFSASALPSEPNPPPGCDTWRKSFKKSFFQNTQDVLYLRIL
nr:MAG TPA: hypothetical protein [Caudoviricetes sp.]